VPAMRYFNDHTRLEHSRQVFLQKYFSLVSQDDRKVNLFESSFLLRTAAFWTRFHQRPNWETEVASLLEEAEVTLNKWSTVKTFSLPVEPGLNWAIDPVYMGSMLNRPISEEFGGVVKECRIANYRKTNHGFNVRYRLRGQKDDKPWVGRALGISRTDSEWVNQGGLALFERLQKLHDSLAEDSEAPLLPRPIAYLPALSLLVLQELTVDRSFASILDSPAALELAPSIAWALAALHQTPLTGERPQPPEAGLQMVRRRVRRLARDRPDLAERINGLLDTLDNKHGRHLPARLGPTLGRLQPKNISVVGGRIAFTDLENLSLAHPLLDVADLLVQISLAPSSEGSDLVADCIREAYMTASGVSRAEIAVFETGALLRRVETSEVAGDVILDRAAAKLAFAFSAEPRV
ncbi:MAG: hypothetical protein ACE5Q6_07270, partial [Dehalococcoidia bacterium]